ncbi:MAG: metallophosphoesterase [Bacteroidales bacterium]
MQIPINIRKTITIFMVLISSVIGVFFITAVEMPKYKGFMIFFILLIFSDFYLWNSVRNIISRQQQLLKYILSFFYWLSLIFSFIFFISLFLMDIKNWNVVYRTYITASMLVFYGPKVFAICCLFIADLIRLIKFIYTFIFKRNKFCQKFYNGRWKPLLYFGHLGAIIIFIILVKGMIFGEFDFKVKKVSIEFEKLPPNFDGIKILQLSDIHLGSWYGKKPLERAIQIVNDLHPDIICFTGDLVNYTSSEALPFEDELKKLNAPLGKYAILGNHDYGEYVTWQNKALINQNMIDLYNFEKRIGWNLLLNSNVKIEKDSNFIYIAGVENWGKNFRFPKKGNINKAISNIDSSAFIILLSHDPSHWDEIISKNFQNIPLTLSGHTHGMQLGISTENFEWSPAQYIYKHWAGLFLNEKSVISQYLYVNKGLGVIGYPGRIGILPEITLIELKRKK